MLSRIMVGYTVRRLGLEDACRFHALRLEGFVSHPFEFRIASDDEADLTLSRVEARLANEFVVGAFASDDTLAGIGGLTVFAGSKLRHKALLWGMYVRGAARGQGLGDMIVGTLLSHARASSVEIVQLTVVADNARARRLYERHGFTTYGIEPCAVKVRVGDAFIYLDEALMSLRL
jgi:ribosomal protein S18 acetylase RimI-like enzyme